MPSPCYRYRVLYVGRSHALLKTLENGLADLSCLVVRCPADATREAHALIRSAIPYAVFLFDEVLAGMGGEELARFALSLYHRAGTPAVIVKEHDDVQTSADEVRGLLGTAD